MYEDDEDFIDEDFETFIEDYYDFNLLDLLDDSVDVLVLADRTNYDLEHNQACKNALKTKD